MSARSRSARTLEQTGKDGRLKNETVHNHLLSITTKLQDENNNLKEKVKRLEASVKNLEDEIPAVKAKPYTEDKRVAHLKKSLAKQDKEFIQFKSDTQSEMKGCYRIRMQGMHSILSVLQAYTKRAGNGLGGDGSDVTTILQDEIEELVEQVKRMKSRSKQAGEHSSELEQERGMALALLRVHSTKDVRLHDVLRAKLDELGAEIRKLRSENDSLQKQIRGVEEESAEMTGKYKALQAKVSDFACASTKSPASSNRRPQSQYTRSWRP